jgi:hypothetical protein
MHLVSLVVDLLVGLLLLSHQLIGYLRLTAFVDSFILRMQRLC